MTLQFLNAPGVLARRCAIPLALGCCTLPMDLARADDSPAATGWPRIQALRLPPDAAAPRIDGRLDEAVWQQAPVYDHFVQYLPEDRQPARWRTTVQIAVSDEALVFAIRAYDPAPELIRAPLGRRDQVRRDQDFVSVVLDTLGQRRSAQFVSIGAAGTLADGLFSAADDSEDLAPDFDVQAATQRLDDGYSVELRWPLAALRFPYRDGAPWRLMLSRSVPREAGHLLVSAPLNKDALSFIAELQPIEGLGDLVERVRERSFLSLRPELSLRRSRDSGPAGLRRASSLALGAELKWQPRADWVVDATLNPDFSQVELDAPQLAGNSRFVLSQQEKRAFFLESTDVVGQTQTEDTDSNPALAAFYSRAISDPDWGLRATWRGATAEATVLSLRDAGGGQLLRAHAYGTDSHEQPAGSQASFARGRLQLSLGSESRLGLALLASQRDYGRAGSNQVLGSDFNLALNGSDQLRGHLLSSSTSIGFSEDGRAQRRASERGHKLWLSGQRRTADWNNSFTLEEISPRFANDNGFVSQSGIRRASLELIRRLPGRSLAPLGEWSRFQAHELEAVLNVSQTQTLRDPALGVRAGERLERRLQPGFWLAAARNTGVWGELGLNSVRARAGGRAHAPRTLLLGFESNPSAWLTLLSAELEWGRRLDVDADRLGRGASLRLEARLRSPLPGGAWLELQQQLGESHVRQPGGARAFSERNARTLAVLHFNARDSLRAIQQGSQFSRRAEAGLDGEQRRGRTLSLVYQHRQGLSRIFSLGANYGRQRPEEERAFELFGKAAWTYQR